MASPDVQRHLDALEALGVRIHICRRCEHCGACACWWNSGSGQQCGRCSAEEENHVRAAKVLARFRADEADPDRRFVVTLSRVHERDCQRLRLADAVMAPALDDETWELAARIFATRRGEIRWPYGIADPSWRLRAKDPAQFEEASPWPGMRATLPSVVRTHLDELYFSDGSPFA